MLIIRFRRRYGMIFMNFNTLARTKKGGTRRGGANLKNNGAVAVVRKEDCADSRHFRAIFEPNFA